MKRGPNFRKIIVGPNRVHLDDDSSIWSNLEVSDRLWLVLCVPFARVRLRGCHELSSRWVEKVNDGLRLFSDVRLGSLRFLFRFASVR